MKNLINYFWLFIPILFASCFEDIDDKPLDKPILEVVTAQQSIYSNITYYKIYQNTTEEIVNHSLGSWDLAFQSAKSGDNVLVNYSTSAKAIKTGIFDFEDVDKSTADELISSDQWKFNDPAYSNVKDSLALKDWENAEVYIVNRGSAFLPEDSYYKIQFINKTESSYTFRYAHVDSDENNEVTIDRSNQYVNNFFTFSDNSTILHEPRIDEWDFFSAPYFGYFETNDGDFVPYNLRGIMINNERGVEVAKIDDEMIDYEVIDLSFAIDQNYSDWKGIIGSNWKKIPNSENPIYHMDTNKKYILKLPDGNYFKLRFLDYYNSEGEVGYTTFEIKLLN